MGYVFRNLGHSDRQTGNKRHHNMVNTICMLHNWGYRPVLIIHNNFEPQNFTAKTWSQNVSLIYTYITLADDGYNIHLHISACKKQSSGCTSKENCWDPYNRKCKLYIVQLSNIFIGCTTWWRPVGFRNA